MQNVDLPYLIPEIEAFFGDPWSVDKFEYRLLANSPSFLKVTCVLGAETS